MSKRRRPEEMREPEVNVELPYDIWCVIGEYILWNEIETMLNFLSVSRSAIRFIQPSLRLLMGNMLTVDQTKPPAKLYKIVRHAYSNNTKLLRSLDKAMLMYYSCTTGSLREWRERASMLLSVFRLAQLHASLVTRKSHGHYVSRISRTLPVAVLNLGRIFYCPPDGKKLPTRIDLMRITHVVLGMSSDPKRLLATTEKQVKTSGSVAHQEICLQALKGSIQPYQRAYSYYALTGGGGGEIKIRPALPTDAFHNVVLVNPKGEDYLHIYSEHCAFIREFRDSCATYRGPKKDAPLALHLDKNQSKDKWKCVYYCKHIYKAINFS